MRESWELRIGVKVESLQHKNFDLWSRCPEHASHHASYYLCSSKYRELGGEARGPRNRPMLWPPKKKEVQGMTWKLSSPLAQITKPDSKRAPLFARRSASPLFPRRIRKRLIFILGANWKILWWILLDMMFPFSYSFCIWLTFLESPIINIMLIPKAMIYTHA